MIRRILAYFLFVLGIVTILFFKKYSGEFIPYPFLFYTVGLALFAGGVLLLKLTPTVAASNHRKRMEEAINDLKTNGEKIRVDLEKCELKEHHYAEEREIQSHTSELLSWVHTEAHVWTAMAGGSHKNVQQVQVMQTVLIYEHRNVRSDTTEKFVSRVIPKDRVTLSFYLDQQKETFLYVDKTDRNRYYFDLDFLIFNE